MKLTVQTKSDAPKICDFHVLLICQTKKLTLKDTPYDKETKNIIKEATIKKIF